ncbi:MAG: hypothetical protein RLZZ546_83 [Bacteroidota bacterium]
MKTYLAEIHDLPIIRELAYAIWPVSYSELLSRDQLDYMLENFYSLESLTRQMLDQGHKFLIAERNDFPLAFASYELNNNDSNFTKIHKLYTQPSEQGKGIGKSLIEIIENESKAAAMIGIMLNVNKYNSAKVFYEKIGFTVKGEEVIDIGEGYVMDDYIMGLTF